MNNPWSEAAKPRWWQERAREANRKMEDDVVLQNLREKYHIPKESFRILCGLAAMNGAEAAVKSLYAQLHNPFPEGDE